MGLRVLYNLTQVHDSSQNLCNACRAVQASPDNFDENHIYRQINGLLYFLEVQMPRALMHCIIWLGSDARNVIQDCRFDRQVIFGKD